MIKIIANRDRTIIYPWEPDLLEWLQENYPYSKYHVVELEHTHKFTGLPFLV
jgi:hypothetical protein